METFEEIWEGDLFGRRKEAEDLIGYLTSVAQRPLTREDGHAHVLAVDSEYGFGKTFFLRRLARHMRKSHAVAYVDAWADDLEDEPLVALAATLEEALGSWSEKSDGIRHSLAEFKNKAGRVAKIVSLGIIKRGVGFLITQGAVDALGDEISQAGDISKDIRKDALKDAAAGLISDASLEDHHDSVSSMDKKIARFRAGKTAIKDMKASLSQIVKHLSDNNMQLPITIIIDELDRCRPTYAIKLLEEIKHLFDVSGVAFVLGLHGKQLSHSVSAAYGERFDGSAYLRRFFSRRYTLKSVDLDPLISNLEKNFSIPIHRFQYFSVRKAGHQTSPSTIPFNSMISQYMDFYGLKARDAFELMEMLQTSAALTHPHRILLPYLVPLIISHIKGGNAPLPNAVTPPKINFAYYSGQDRGRWVETTFSEAADQFHIAAQRDDNTLMHSVNQENPSPIVEAIAALRFNDLPADSYARPEKCVDLLQTVERFSIGPVDTN